MNYLWGGMILIGVLYGALTGNLDAVTAQALSSAKEAITLCITMAGAMAFWVGIMRIAERAGMVARAARRMGPVLGGNSCGAVGNERTKKAGCRKWQGNRCHV